MYCNAFRANQEEMEWPDIQLFFASASDNTDGGLFNRRNLGMEDELYASVYEPILYKDAFTIAPLLLRPRSRGRLELRDKSPYSHPLIHANYLADPRDINSLVENINRFFNCVKKYKSTTFLYQTFYAIYSTKSQTKRNK